ncbi:MAG: serine/threonine protein kinase, partial [Gemmatimonadetes bacterium]|nr:serine/threonine protein kinase [Gemmatimonadota bacterium]
MSRLPASVTDAPDLQLLRARVEEALGAQYRLGAVLGRGGMAVVFAAEDVQLQRPVALKVLPPDLAVRPDVRERFVREAQVAARLNHPHIVPIYAVHEAPQLVCFAMAQVVGDTLAQRLRRDPQPPWEQVAALLEQVADALAYAHAAGVVHRDIKPDNVLLDRASGRVLVTDFGIARAMEGGSRLTQTGVAMGTPSFMSPEQATGEREVDGRSDLYALGVVGYLLLTGTLPFEAPNTPALLLKHVSEPLPPVRVRRAEVPPPLADVVERCLAKRPEDRFPHALALRDTLRVLQRSGVLGGSAPQAHAVLPVGLPPRQGDKPGHRAEHWSPRPVSAGLSVPSAPLPPAEVEPAPAKLERRVRRFRGQVVCSAFVLAGLAVLNAFTSSYPWVLWVLFGMTVSLLRRFQKLHEDGVGWRDVIGARGAPRALPGAADTAEARRQGRLAALASAEVLASSLGALVRAAVDDRVALEEVAASLSPSDRALVPELEETGDALLGRIGTLAGALARLERDLPRESPLSAGGAAPSSDQWALLERQRASLEALEARRAEMRDQV